MQRTPVGATGLELPPVVFGSSNLGNLFVAPSDETKLAVSKCWFEQVPKPVVIDTAGKYGAGLALEVIGRNLRALGIGPEEVIISNKLGWRRKPLSAAGPTFEPGAWVDLEHDAEQAISREGIRACWEEGNRLLGAPYNAQMLSVHDPDEYLAAAADADDRQRRLGNILDAYDALQELKRSGDASAIGIGAKDWRVIEEIDRLVELDWVMIANSFTVFRHPPELIAFLETLAAKGITVINSALFHSGFLVGGEYFDYRRVDPAKPADGELISKRKAFWSVCETHGVTPAEACLRFGISPPAVAALAMNSSRPERIAHDVASIGSDIPDAFWAELKAAGLIDPRYPYL